MCLTRAIKITPGKDLTVYKVLRVSKFKDEFKPEAYYSPYFSETNWIVGKRKSLNVDSPDIKLGDMWENTVVEGNAFHSFHTYARAKEEALYCVSLTKSVMADGTYAICECTIPKDSRFVYRGRCDRGISYASSDLVLNRICDYFSTYNSAYKIYEND